MLFDLFEGIALVGEVLRLDVHSKTWIEELDKVLNGNVHFLEFGGK
ncbi:hypothetical protein DJ93_4541 [Bacillus clarus]|uniref:Uncharacterized protein n=1 Tax=Bacillus clarus TaxID=2338372 RepID=A0A090YUY4_9BACI|nr:hypothetical protein DJ93_4541 [Bacillus clarus]